MLRRRLPLCIYFFASFAALGAYSPFFPRWLVARNIQGLAMGSVVATLPAMGFIGPPVVGLVSDALGLRSWTLRVACLGSLIAFTFLAGAGALSHELTYVEVLTAVIIFSVFRAPMLMMADVIAVEREPETGMPYARVRLWGSIGFLVASLFSGRFLDPESPTMLPLIVAIPLFIAFLSALALPPVKGTVTRLPLLAEIRSLISSSDFPLFLSVAFTAELAISSYDICYSLYLTDLGASTSVVGFAWAFGVVVEIGLMMVATPLILKYRPTNLVVAALVCAAIRCALVASIGSVAGLVAIQPLHALSVAMFWISALSHLKTRVPKHAFASAQGLFSAAAAGGSLVGMLLWGALYGEVGGRVAFGVAMLVASVAACLAAGWTKRAHRIPLSIPPSAVCPPARP